MRGQETSLSGIFFLPEIPLLSGTLLMTLVFQLNHMYLISGEVQQEGNREGSNSSLNEAAAVSPRHVPFNHSPMSPVRIRTLKSSSSSMSSMSPSSPKTSLLSKAVSGACQQGTRKRRLLPSLPDIKNKPAETSRISSSPGQCSNQSADGANKKATSVSQNVKLNEKVFFKDTVVGDGVKPLQATDTCVNIGTLTHPQHGDDAEREEKNSFGQRSLHAIPENSSSKGMGNQAFALTEREKQRSTRCETGGLQNDKSLEDLLKMHNKKIVSARSQYDENGRKIRTAEPSFCPAPSKKMSLSATCKRPASTVDKPMVAAKQKRRSCVASVSNVQSEMTKSNTRSISSNTSANVNKKSKVSSTSNQQTAKQKRRSCMASLQYDGQSDKADKELRDLIAQHNSRVSAKRS